MLLPDAVIRRLEGATVLDRIGEPLRSVASRLVRPRIVRNLLSGSNLGHPLHPLLTDLPIGAWTMAELLDAIGGKAAAPAADLLVGAGIVAAVPTAATGANDWSDTYGEETRVGLVHAAANVTALSLYVSSLIARRRGRRAGGKALGLAGFSVLLAGGYLGGYLSFVKGVNVNHTAFEHGPEDWTAVLPDAELGAGQHRKVLAGDVPMLLVRTDAGLRALANTCTHAGGPLDEGRIVDGCVVCPWHGSTFHLADGAIERGPASTRQPSYATRVRDGQIEVRAER